jgi:hypothetical protein
MGKVCEHDGCTKEPRLNTPGEMGGRFCAAHKLGGMIDLGKKRAAALMDGTEALMLLAGNKRPNHKD